jgi:hypothetical protein
MTRVPESDRPALRLCLVSMLLGVGGVPAMAQTAQPSGSGAMASVPSPYYLGASQAFYRDSNVYRVPFGPADNYSSTSLLAGADQMLSRQRLFGTARVTLNRYQNEKPLDNTSYDFTGGLDWQTIYNLSGNVTATLDQRLASPSASTITPVQTRNLETRRGFSGLARWGGESLLTVEGRAAMSWVDYSAQEFQSSEARSDSASLGVFYRPGARLRLGLAARVERTESPNALLLGNGERVGNATRSDNLDFLTEYDAGSNLNAATRLSYTRQTNSGFSTADFSGLTGSVSVGYRPTAKLAFNVGAARDTGFDSGSNVYVAPVGTPGAPVTTPIQPNAYQNNQLTDSVSAGVSYSATAKINLNASARASRAHIIATSTAGDPAKIVDENRGASLAANYAYSRALSFACSLSRDRRVVTGPAIYAYSVNIYSCSGQFLWQ